ncbi:hypothetical protein ID866_8236 [Astraeus odoratus]|nr:hypothetical protein ID866_8236 [Astraeus odoratus]
MFGWLAVAYHCVFGLFTMGMVYQLPDFVARCPRKSSPISEHFSALQEEFHGWVDTFSLFGPAERMECKNCKLPLAVALSFPFADLNGLRAITHFMMAFILLDKAKCVLLAVSLTSFQKTPAARRLLSRTQREIRLHIWPPSMIHKQASNHRIPS